MKPAPVPPPLHFAHRCLSVRYSRSVFESIVRAAFPLCLAESEKAGGPLARLPAVEVTVLGRSAMARVHRDFLGEPGPTDAITFPYGEVLICATVAAARGKEFGNTPTRELALYAIHGILHLAGLDDTSPPAARRMHAAQDRILQAAAKLQL
jgi:probable rRNA maturation factor